MLKASVQRSNEAGIYTPNEQPKVPELAPQKGNGHHLPVPFIFRGELAGSNYIAHSKKINHLSRYSKPPKMAGWDFPPALVGFHPVRVSPVPNAARVG